MAVLIEIAKQPIDPFAMVLMFNRGPGLIGDCEAAWRGRPGQGQ